LGTGETPMMLDIDEIKEEDEEIAEMIGIVFL
jgi:hypothetical protein